jgi:HK97 family phage prohead protease
MVEYKNLSNAVLNATDGTFYGYASIFNTRDSHNDIILPKAFENSLKIKGVSNIKLFWQHDSSRQIGYFTNIHEDYLGLFVEGKFDNYKSYCLVKNNIVSGLSIGYRTKNYNFDKNGSRILGEIDLIEISVVNFPANKHSKVTYCK